MDRDRLLRSGNEQNPPTNDRFEVGNPPYFCSVKLRIMNENSKTFLLVLLGMLTAFGPFVTDMYLPTLPAMTDYFQTSSSMVQMGLTTSMIGLALGQLLFGPLSDKYGRRLPLLTALWLFIAATLLCIFATNIRQFIVMRFLQGIAGAGGIVISRSVATDRFAGRDLAGDLPRGEALGRGEEGDPLRQGDALRCGVLLLQMVQALISPSRNVIRYLILPSLRK